MGAFVRCIILIGIGAALAHSGRPRAHDASKTASKSIICDHDREKLAVFVYDAVTRVNEALVGNIESIDTALTAILAGALAAVLFTIDKIGDLPHALGVCALVLFGCSAMTCAFGYFVGLLSGIRDPAGMRPRKFVADVVEQPGVAIVGAIHDQIENADENMTIRLNKRVSALVAVALLIGGVVAVAVARWTVLVV